MNEPSNKIAYNQLKAINKRFCYGAEKLRWQLPNKVFDNNNPNTDDEFDINAGWLRSLTPTGNCPYVYFLDIDGKVLDTPMLKAGIRLAKILHGITNRRPVYKASGKAGLHIYYKFWFPRNWTRDHIFEKMRDLTYTAYERSGIKDQGYLCGMLKKDSLPENCPGFIDMRVYRDGMIRGFSYHPGSGKYSVPFLEEDSLSLINKRMELKVQMPKNVNIEAMPFSMKWDLDHYKESTTYTEARKSRDMSYLERMVDKDYKGDKYYKSLPSYMKAIVRMDDDIDHDLKYVLVSHFAYYYPALSGDDIAEWIWKRCKWDDLDDFGTTAYQANYIKSWIEKNKKFDNVFGFHNSGGRPLKKENYL